MRSEASTTLRTAMATAVLATLLGACSLLPQAAPGAAAASSPAALTEGTPGLSPAASLRLDGDIDLARWWTQFADPSLDAWMERALAHNHDLALAAARSREARARLDEVHGARLPNLDLQARNSRARLSADGGLQPGMNRTQSEHQVALVAGYDLDLWGRLTAADQAARQRLLAQDWARAGVAWSLTAQVADAHFSLRAVQRQIELSEAIRASRQRTVALRQRELAAGSTAEFELRRAEAELAGTEATLVALRRQAVSLRGTLDLLAGTNLAEAAAPAQSPPALDTAAAFQARLPQGVAERWLVNRPDLRQAEAQLAASRADLAAARAATLPALRLSGSLGSDVRSLSGLFNGPGFVWSMALGLTQSIFDGGANQARVEQALARDEAALMQYRRAVLGAVVELRDAYAALDLAEQARRVQADRVQTLERARRLAAAGVSAGALPTIDLLDAERNAWQAQLDEVASVRDRLIGHVAVMKALGGGHAAQAS